MQEDYKTDVVCLSDYLAAKRSSCQSLTNFAQLTPQLLKPAVADALAELMAPIRAAYEASAEWQEITLKAYPPPAPKKKEKKQKDKGSRYPGAKPQQNDESAPAAVEA